METRTLLLESDFPKDQQGSMEGMKIIDIDPWEARSKLEGCNYQGGLQRLMEWGACAIFRTGRDAYHFNCQDWTFRFETTTARIFAQWRKLPYGENSYGWTCIIDE